MKALSYEAHDIRVRDDRAIVEIISSDQITEDGIIIPGTVKAVNSSKVSIDSYIGVILNDVTYSGESASANGQLSKGDKVLFQEFAGHHTAPTDKGLVKVIETNLIYAKFEGKGMDIENVKSCGTRVLVELVENGEFDENGIYKGKGTDPRNIDIEYGMIKHVSENAKMSYKVGDVVAWESYAGNLPPIENCKVLQEHDILYGIE